MTELVQPLKWDTDFFGIKIGRITAAQLTAETIEQIEAIHRRAQYACLYFQANPDDYQTVRLAETHGFHLADVRILLEHPFDNRPAPVPRYPIPKEIVLDAPRPRDKSLLEEISVQIGHTSRFCFDQQFPADACARLYRAWMEKVTRDDIVLVAYLENEPLGLIAGSLADGVGSIELAGVRREFRGRGAGTALVRGILDSLREQGATRVDVVTQARNVGAQRLYQQMGFFTREMTLYYHKWAQE